MYFPLVSLPILAIWGLAYARLPIDATPRLPVLFNWTPSLPLSHRLAGAQLTCSAATTIVFSFNGEAQGALPGLRVGLLQGSCRACRAVP
ncbi:MAG: hypothetical protein IPP18_15130 [Rhodocyclaceae bacterium]|nr:hypothetical protein [Rhodocyclaceae bacterium]